MKNASLLTLMVALGMGATAIAPTAAEARGDRERPTFESLDANGDGMITADDIEAVRVARFSEMDANGDGTISLDEFQAQAAANSAERAERMFNRLDADGDGALGQDVLSKGRGGGDRMIERLDTDGDGAVSEEEFAELEKRMRDGRRFGGRDK